MSPSPHPPCVGSGFQKVCHFLLCARLLFGLVKLRIASQKAEAWAGENSNLKIGFTTTKSSHGSLAEKNFGLLGEPQCARCARYVRATRDYEKCPRFSPPTRLLDGPLPPGGTILVPCSVLACQRLFFGQKFLPKYLAHIS